MFTLLPETNMAPPEYVAEDNVKYDLSTVTLSPMIDIEPPVEVESPKLIPLLLVHVTLYIPPRFPFQ